MYAADDEDTVFLADPSPHICPKTPVRSPDPACLQHASEGTDESATGRRHNVVQGGGGLLDRFDAVMLRHRPVHPELHGSVAGGKIRESVGTLRALDPDPGFVDRIAHSFVQAGQSQPKTPAVRSAYTNPSRACFKATDRGSPNQMLSWTPTRPYAKKAAGPAVPNTDM